MIYQNVLVGPFFGDFETEIIDFRPYARWIQKVLNPDNMFVATHSNRLFMYEWATAIPVYEDFSRDELNQSGLTHNAVSQKDINLITRRVKSDLLTNSKLQKKDILHFNTAYTKSPHWYPLYKKVFDPITISRNKKNYILYIPHIKEKYNVIHEIYTFLMNKYDNVIVAGDLKTHLHEYNVMLKNPAYFLDVYSDLVNLISNAKVVVSPYSHWTILSLLQNTPVISWGSYPEYYSNSTQHQIVAKNMPTDNLKNIIEVFINKIK